MLSEIESALEVKFLVRVENLVVISSLAPTRATSNGKGITWETPI
jgi:hypothetical protein